VAFRSARCGAEPKTINAMGTSRTAKRQHLSNQPDARSRMVPPKRKAIHVNDVSDARFEVKYAVWKELLLDLTTSNRLLNFRETTVSTVQVTFSDALALFDAIVLRERSLKFSPIVVGRYSVKPKMRSLRPNTACPPATWKRTPPPDLERSLYRLTSLARTFRQECGINTLCGEIGLKVVGQRRPSGNELIEGRLLAAGSRATFASWHQRGRSCDAGRSVEECDERRSCVRRWTWGVL
jgi:hypothetical protein